MLSVRERQIFHDLLHEVSKLGKLTEMENRIVVDRDWG